MSFSAVLPWYWPLAFSSWPHFSSWPWVWWCLLLGCLGLVLASFVNVVVYRLPLMLAAKPQYKHLNLSWPASHCPACLKPLSWWHKVPLISWVLLRGRCAQCSQPIAWRYVAIELAGLVLALLVAWRFTAGWSSLVYLLVLLSWLALAVIDAKTYLLPDKITLPLVWAGLIWHWLVAPVAVFDQAFWGAIAGYGSLWLIFWLFKWLTGKEGLGYGDFKLLAGIGAWLGVAALVPVVLLASCFGLLHALGLKLLGRWQGQELPFGPALIAAASLLLLGGTDLTSLLGLGAWAVLLD